MRKKVFSIKTSGCNIEIRGDATAVSSKTRTFENDEILIN